MFKKVIRNITFQARENDYSSTVDFRELSTEKTILDCISEFCNYDEDTIYKIYSGEELRHEFSNNDFRSATEKMTLGLFEAQKKVVNVEIQENIFQTIPSEDKKIEKLIKSRLVIIYY